MKLSSHILAAPLLGPLYLIGGTESVFIAATASILIDLDHLHLLIKEKAFTPKKLAELSQNIYDENSIQRCFKDVTYALHSVEVNALLLAFSYWYSPLFYVMVGFSLHVCCDIIHHHRHKLPVWSWLILTTYFLRLRKKFFAQRANP